MSPLAGAMLQEQIAPRIRSTLPRFFAPLGSEDQEELAQDALAMAAGILASAEAKDKSVSAGNVAYYATKLLKAGRRSTGFSRTDAMHPGTQLHGRSQVRSLEEPLGAEEGEEGLLLGDVLATEADDPSQSGARNLDWQALLGTLDEKARSILNCIAEGRPLREVALAYGISRSGVHGLKEKLKETIAQFMGPDLLAQVGRLPRWKDNLRASSERQACRLARQAA